MLVTGSVHQRLRRKRKARGLCVVAGCKLAPQGSRCVKHAAEHAAKAAAVVAERRAQSLCVTCAEPSGPAYYCEECKVRRKVARP